MSADRGPYHEFPWALFLPPDEIPQMLADIAATESVEALAQVVREWRATAEIHADPDLYAALTGPVNDLPADLARLLLWLVDELDAQASAHNDPGPSLDILDHLRCFALQTDRRGLIPWPEGLPRPDIAAIPDDQFEAMAATTTDPEWVAGLRQDRQRRRESSAVTVIPAALFDDLMASLDEPDPAPALERVAHRMRQFVRRDPR